MKRPGLIIALLGACTAAWAQAPPTKAGVISMQGVIAGTKEGQKARQQFEAKWQPKEKEFTQRRDEVTRLEEQLNKGGSVLSEEAHNQREKELDQKKKKLERDISDAKDELTAEEQAVLQRLGQKALAVLAKYGKDNGYTIIVDTSNPDSPVLYAEPGTDVTQDVIALYDKANATTGPSIAPPAGTPRPATTAPPASAPPH